MPVPSDFDIRRPSGAWTIECTFTRENGIVARVLEAHHHHPGDPEEEDVARPSRARRSGRRRAAAGVSSGQPSVANGHSWLENQVSSTSGSRSQPSPSGGSTPDVDLVLAAVVDGDLVPPPELAGDAPRPDVLQPLDVAAALALGVDRACRPSRTASSAGAASSSMRMNHCSEISGSIRSPERCENGHVVRVGLGAGDPALLAQGGDDRLARLERGHAREALARRLGHAAVLADRGDLLEPVRAADLEVVRVVAGRDLQRAGAELGLHVGVGDDLQPAADERQDRRLADQPRVAVVVGVHGDRRVGQHRLRAHGGDRHRAVPARQRVVDVVERVGDLALLDLEVGDRRARARVPVDHVVVAVDQALVVEVDEDLHHGAHVARRRA